MSLLCTEERNMFTPSDAFARTRKAIFRIPIEPNSAGDWWWGTGFFISAEGYALTAFHNLPRNIANQRKGYVKGLNRDGKEFFLNHWGSDSPKLASLYPRVILSLV
jgi:hypothetical protein